MAYPYTASKISQNPAIVGKNATLVISAYGSTFTHKVEYTFGSLTGMVVDGKPGGSYIWTIPTEFYSEIPVGDTSKNGTMTCQTYSYEGDLLGTSTCDFKVSINTADAPTIETWVYDTNSVTTALTGDNAKIIQGYSNIHCEMQATSNNSSDIASVKITDGIDTYSDYSCTFEKGTRTTYTFYATDSRGLTAKVSRIPTTLAYQALTCKMSDMNLASDGTCKFTVSGIFWNSSFGAQQNSYTVTYRHRQGDSAWGDWTSVSTSLTPHYYSTGDYSYSSYTGTVSITGLDYEQPQFIQVKAADKLATVNLEYNTITSTPVFDWSGEDFNFNVPVKFSAGITGLTNLDGIYGTCDTSDSITAKVVDCTDFPGLSAGVSVRVKFAYGNSVTAPALNVRGSGAKTVVSYDKTSDAGYMWVAGEVVDFVYDGTYWVIVNGAKASTTNYGKTMLSNTRSDSENIAATPKCVNQAVTDVNQNISLANSRITTLSNSIDSIKNTAASTTTKGLVKLATTISDDDTTAATPGAVQDAVSSAIGGFPAIEYGEWTPTLNVTAKPRVGSNTLKGWYMKVGNVVTVGFYLYVNGTSNVSSNTIEISCTDIPYVPSNTSTHPIGGGGYLYGYSGGVGSTTYDFIGWQAYGSSSTMTIVPCGSSGADMNYPTYSSSGGYWNIQASGTICFTTE